MGATANRVQPWLDDGDLRLYHGDALTVLQGLPAGIAQTCVTSPPYWGLRDYGTGQWSGGDEACDHKRPVPKGGSSTLTNWAGTSDAQEEYAAKLKATASYERDCGKCGAQRVDSQLGLEATPTEYVANMVALFREVRRVLRDDGTLWLNLGDSYAGATNGNTYKTTDDKRAEMGERIFGAARRPRTIPAGLKPKDLVGIPWRVAFALQADGWYLRSDIIWSKPNPMPESVSDRPTKAHEYLFLFSKQPRYFYDADAIREPNTEASMADYESRGQIAKSSGNGETACGHGGAARVGLVANGRNRRSVWTIPTQPFPEAHFATYPEELVRPCILAGTSEKGECVGCGAPWRRITQTTRGFTDGSCNGCGRPRAQHVVSAKSVMSGSSGAKAILPPGSNQEGSATRLDDGAVPCAANETMGWEPSCDCYENDRVAVADGVPVSRPQLVLDPFIGSGTTSLVARKHGRRSLGIDLSTEYLHIAAKRTQQLSLLGGPEPAPRLEPKRGLTGGAYSPPGQSPHSNARDGDAA